VLLSRSHSRSVQFNGQQKPITCLTAVKYMIYFHCFGSRVCGAFEIVIGCEYEILEPAIDSGLEIYPAQTDRSMFFDG
jgi:hypothetical protein